MRGRRLEERHPASWWRRLAVASVLVTVLGGASLGASNGASNGLPVPSPLGPAQAAAADDQEDAGGQEEAGVGGEVVTVMSRNLYLGADVGVALELLPDMPAAAQFMWQQVAATDFTTRASLLAAEAARHEPAVIGLQEATRWRCRPGNVGRAVDVFDFTLQFLEATREAGVEYIVAEHDGDRALQPGYAIPALPFLSTVEDPDTFQPLFGRDAATCGFDLADALLVRADLADRVLDVGTGWYGDRYAVVPTVLVIDRGYAWADIEFDSGVVRFVTTHLESLWDEDAPTHGAMQARQLVDDLAVTTSPLVVMGDLNSDPRDPRPPGDPNPALQPVASDACPAQVTDLRVATASAACNSYWVLRQAGYEDAGPDALDPRNHTWGTSAELAGPDPKRVDDALTQGNPYGFTDRLDYVLVRNGIEPVEARIIGNVWPGGEDNWACSTATQAANSAAMAEALAAGAVTTEVLERGECLPTDHAGVVAQVRLPDDEMAAASASDPPPSRFRSPIGIWGGVGLLLLLVVVWRISRRLRRRSRRLATERKQREQAAR